MPMTSSNRADGSTALRPEAYSASQEAAPCCSWSEVCPLGPRTGSSGGAAAGPDRAEDDGDSERPGRRQGDQRDQLVPPGELEQVGGQDQRRRGGEDQQAGEGELACSGIRAGAQRRDRPGQPGQG